MTQPRRDIAVVLSGGGMNGVLMEFGFLRRLQESTLWGRIGWIFGTSAGALAGTMAALDRLDELEEMLISLRADETFRPNRLWRLPLLGLHDYRLPETVTSRLGDPLELGRALAESPVELVVLATDLTDPNDREDGFELAYSSRTTPPEEMVQAIFASAAISALVLPLRVGDRIATDGSWVRNFPLGYAYDHDVGLIVAFRYLPRYPEMTAAGLAALRRRLERFGRIPPVKALVAELRVAEERAERGEPAHLGDMFARLARVSIMRNTQLEERRAADRDQELHELASLQEDVVGLVRERDGGLADEIEQRFAAARFPFRHERVVPRITVRGSSAGISLDPGFRSAQSWPEEDKRRLMLRGWALADAELRTAGLA